MKDITQCSFPNAKWQLVLVWDVCYLGKQNQFISGSHLWHNFSTPSPKPTESRDKTKLGELVCQNEGWCCWNASSVLPAGLGLCCRTIWGSSSDSCDSSPHLTLSRVRAAKNHNKMYNFPLLASAFSWPNPRPPAVMWVVMNRQCPTAQPQYPGHTTKAGDFWGTYSEHSSRIFSIHIFACQWNKFALKPVLVRWVSVCHWGDAFNRAHLPFLVYWVTDLKKSCCSELVFFLGCFNSISSAWVLCGY